MRSIGFVGKTDKTELVEYIAKTLATMGNKVMFIDATSTQKTRFTIPVIMGTEDQMQYVVQYDSIDVAVGFSNILELKKYMLSKGEDFTEYEYILVDADTEEMCEEYDLKGANKLFFVSSLDKMHLTKGTELLKYICATKRREDPEGKVDVQKILLYSNLNLPDSRYIDRLTENLPIRWEPKNIDLPFDEGDLSAAIQTQYASKINMRYLTKPYKEGVVNIVAAITGANLNDLRKVVKNIEHTAKFN